MMVSPEHYYETYLKSRTPAQIMTVIRGLKQEVGHLKNVMENPDFECRDLTFSEEAVQLEYIREYLRRAVLALGEAGESYRPSKTEQRAMSFDESIGNIQRIVLSEDSTEFGWRIRSCTLDGEEFCMQTWTAEGVTDSCRVSRKTVLQELRRIHMGEWRANYDPARFGKCVSDGLHWKLEIFYGENRRPLRITGQRACPYNYDRLRTLLRLN